MLILNTPGFARSSPAPGESEPLPGDNFPLAIDLTTAGRIGFYIDYSELTTNGTHTFYVCRTHGTVGTVGVTYTTSGDTHTTVTDTFSWADGEADVKSFSVPVTAGNLVTHDGLGLGEHRIVATLSSPTGGAALHNLTHTRAYGIIDNSSMIASDANAWFVDYDAVSDGVGTAADPFNDFATLRTNQTSTSKRYCYGKGTTIPDQALTGSILGLNMDLGAGDFSGTSETARTFIMAWPGSTWTIDGSTNTDVAGFYADTVLDYVTFKNITFTDLDTTGIGGPPNQCFAVWFNIDSTAPTVENCTMDGIAAGATSSTAAIFADGAPIGLRMWRCTVSNMSKSSGGLPNAFEIFDGGSASIQRCEFNGCGIYQKDSPNTGEIGIAVRWCIMDEQIRLGGLSGNPSPNYMVVQGNLLSKTISYANPAIRLDSAGTSVGVKPWIVGNVFNDCGHSSSFPTILSEDDEFEDHIIFNNIFYEGVGFVRLNDEGTPVGFEFCDEDHEHNVASTGVWRWNYLGTAYLTTALFNTSESFEGNMTSGDPLFTNLATNDVTLGVGSPCIGVGVSSTDKGIFTFGFEPLGAS